MDPNVTGAVEIPLDKPSTLRYGAYTPYRVSQYSRDVKGGSGGQWAYHQVIIYAWCLLDPSDVRRFPEPESLAAYITLENLGEYLPLVIEAITLGTPTEKKTTALKTGRSSGGSSG